MQLKIGAGEIRKMKKILVLGKHSFVGTSFIEYITSNFSNDFIVDNISSIGDDWKTVNFGEYDAIYNVAGLAHVKAKKSMESAYYAINRDLPVEMAKKAKKDGAKQFVHMSSMIVYGGMSKVGVPNMIAKDTAPAPVNFYGDSKLQADRILEELADEFFQVAIIRPPLLYSHNARDNFPLLIRFSQKFPVFPSLKNEQSMLYVYNLAELIRLIIVNGDGGIFYPQNKEYTSTSYMVKQFADRFGHKMKVVSFFNPMLRLCSHFVPVVNKAFGNLTYDKELSGYYDWSYCIYSLDESIDLVAKRVMEKAKNDFEV